MSSNTNQPNETSQQATQLENRLWNDPEYQKAIQQVTQVSKEDYPFTKQALEQTESNLNELERKISQEIANIKAKTQGKAKAETAKEVISLLEKTKQDLNQQIKTQIKTVHESLEAKKSSLDYFTIAFMGKTKAGKSTLHSILTEQGWDAIGSGKQRTTRSNRIYTWNNIRIIDTPGIGAPDGKSDEETAQSIIDEADLIIFVVTNDSQQESEFQFLKLLKEKAKPLCILINVLKNFNDPRRGDYELKRFLKNPDQLFDDKEMQGHFNRIQGYAKKYYGNDYFSIVPVMFLAAQLSHQEKHQQHKEQLWEASQIENFLEQIRISIVEQGTICRSQNLLGSSVKDIEDTYLWAKEQSISYHKLAQAIREKPSKVEREIDRAMQEVEKNLKNEIAKVFKELKNSVPQFAEDYWNSSEETLNRAWESKLKSRKFEENFNNVIKQQWNNFTKKVQQSLEGIGKDLQFSAKLGGISGFRLNQQDTSDNKNFFRFGGGFLGIAGAIAIFFPVAFIPGIIAGVVGGIMSFISGFLDSEADKKRKAVQKISQSLNQQINQQESQVTNQVTAEFRRNCNQVKTELKTYFEQIMAGLDAISKQLKISESNIEKQVTFLNCAYGKRIIDWSQKRYEPLTQDEINREVVSVKRDIGKKIMIEVKNQLTITRSQEELDSILQEKVIIKANHKLLVPVKKNTASQTLTRNTSQSSQVVANAQKSQASIVKNNSEEEVNNATKRESKQSLEFVEELVQQSLFDTSPKLERKLKEENWKEAEKITFDFMLQLIEFPKQQAFQDENITDFDRHIIETINQHWHQFYFSILKKLDQFWRKYSQDKYGLTLQQGTYRNTANHYLASWYKVGVDRQQDDQLFFPLYSRFHLFKLKPQVNFKLRNELLKIKKDWEKLQQDHNEIMNQVRNLQQETLQYIKQGNKKLVEMTNFNQQNYRKEAKKKQDELEKIVKVTEKLFSE
jgi:tRNA U34 5-carboxymethylaminomethyl modifying GTPase MnmE/TrmE